MPRVSVHEEAHVVGAVTRAVSGVPEGRRRLPRLARPLLILVIFIAMGGMLLFLFERLSIAFTFAGLIEALRTTPPRLILSALAATAVSYLALLGYDLSALRYIGARPPLRSVVLASFCGYALGNAVGLGSLSGGAVRYRIYTSAGLSPGQIARVVGFLAAAFPVGLAVVAATGLVFEAGLASRILDVPAGLVRGLAVVVLVAVAGFIALSARQRRKLAIGPFELALPSARLALLQIGLAAADIVAAAAVLWVLLPPSGVGLLGFVPIFAAGLALSVLSHIPAGAGVFELVILYGLGGRAPAESVLAALLTYRAIYFGLPLLGAMAVLAGYEVRRGLGGALAGGSGEQLVRAAGRLTPKFLGVLVFAAGILLLVSGATPGFGDRLAVVAAHLPLWMVETSHFLGSVVGIALLFAARGLIHRLDAAWWLTLMLVVADFGFALAKGLAFGEAALMAFLVVVLLATRREFPRRASLLEIPVTFEWLVAVGAILAGVIWVLFFAFRDVQYSHDLWWQFEFDAEAPRALRAMVGVALAGVVFGLAQLLRPAPGRVFRPTAPEVAAARQIIEGQTRADAQLALMGDKSFLFAPSGTAFLMFRRRGRTWAALGDPVGPCEEWADLIWRFVEMADAHGGRAVFYQVRGDRLPLYVDAGLRLLKLGEEARVMLAEFDLKGAERADLRYALKRGERDGLAVEIVPVERVTEVFATLAEISVAWLARHRGGEKGFSVAAFKCDYVLSQPVALLREHGRPVAFATLMTTSLAEEATVGLMRHVPEASRYAMEFLFLKLILHFKEQSYGSFSLGVAPLSGLRTHRLAPRWHRLGRLIWAYGRRFYNFQGLRTFKNKFHPEWQPRYLAAPGSLGPYLALVDIAALTTARSDGREE